MDETVRGTLRPPRDAPARGETTHAVARVDGVVVEQILSDRLDAPVDYVAPVDEWVLVLAGAARLEVDGEPVALRPGGWLSLPAGTPHRLTTTEPGTSWITVTGTASPVR
jgi:cupin 2 domain-containing protein